MNFDNEEIIRNMRFEEFIDFMKFEDINYDDMIINEFYKRMERPDNLLKEVTNKTEKKCFNITDDIYRTCDVGFYKDAEKTDKVYESRLLFVQNRNYISKYGTKNRAEILDMMKRIYDYLNMERFKRKFKLKKYVFNLFTYIEELSVEDYENNYKDKSFISLQQYFDDIITNDIFYMFKNKDNFKIKCKNRIIYDDDTDMGPLDINSTFRYFTIKDMTNIKSVKVLNIYYVEFDDFNIV